MKRLLIAAMIAPFVVGTAAAQGKSADAPGQDRTCLVTFKDGSSTADTNVAGTKWLPRKAAEAQASRDGNTQVFDYENDPLVTDGTYASAQELCETHFGG